MNSNKIILDLCGGTGSWSKPYREAGFDVRVITMPRFDVKKCSFNRVRSEITFFSTIGNHMTIYVPDVYGILAAPPCTQFSRARTVARTPRDLDGAMEIVQACLGIVQEVRKNPENNLRFWALENPMSMLRQLLGNPPHSFRGWEYGDKHVKFTDLWGYYSMPTKKVKTPPAFDKKKWASPKCPAEYRHLKLDRAAIRAITPPGFAEAFFKANK